MVDTVRTGCGGGGRDVALSSTGQLAWTGVCGEGSTAAGADAGVYVAPLAGGAPRRAGGPDGVAAHEPSWSADGSALVFTVGQNSIGGRFEVNNTQPGMMWIVDARGARETGVAGESAVWSPDGTRIAYFADDRADPNELPGGPRIYTMRPDGSERRRIFMNDLVSTYPEYFYGPYPTYVRDGKAFGPMVWSPDGRWLAFSRQFEAGASIWRLEVDTGRLEQVTAPDR
jgi:Tol biopolymer transport system component